MLLLVGAIKVITLKFNGYQKPLHVLHDAKRDFYRYYQMGQTTKPQYLKTLKNKVLVIESYEISIRTDPGMAKEELSGL